MTAETILPSTTTEHDWADEIEARLGGKDRHPLGAAEQAAEMFPTSGAILLLAAIAALIEEKPERCIAFIKRLNKRYESCPAHDLCHAIALAQQNRWPIAQAVLREKVRYLRQIRMFYPPEVPSAWLNRWVSDILRWSPNRTPARPHPVRARQPKDKTPRPKIKPRQPANPPRSPVDEPPPFRPLPADIPLRLSLPGQEAFSSLNLAGPDDVQDFRLRFDLAELSLLKGFDELLCLPLLRNVERHWYQVETARKVLRNFRGRVLLADEVGLGKTVEAGMILKEYLLRGMAVSALILTPSSLVGQWREEMASKFSIEFTTTQDSMLHRDAEVFWTAPRIIASISTARRQPHAACIRGRTFDIVIVDEAHHLKNRRTQNWELVNSLQKRFLLLLSATPIQNNLVELYNILTLLKPGIFKTEKEFRSAHMLAGRPRAPANRDRLRDLMKDVMIRNTRALVDVRLPPRHAATIRVDPSADERLCYCELDRLARADRLSGGPTHHQLAIRHLLEAAGSCPAAAASALQRFEESSRNSEWAALRDSYEVLPSGGKLRSFLDLLRRNPEEKKLVFVRFRDTLKHLDAALRDEAIPFAVFHGELTGQQKDAAIEDFREGVPVLLSTETGGEGRNIQFCNTIINFDLPWNPQTIEQRIGRVHRIGQTRDVFVFNLSTRGTIEDRILAILDEKINMFELVVGEVQSILGELQEEQDFGQMVFAAWAETTDADREKAFETLGNRLSEARGDYEAVKKLDEDLFGDDFEVV